MVRLTKSVSERPRRHPLSYVEIAAWTGGSTGIGVSNQPIAGEIHCPCNDYPKDFHEGRETEDLLTQKSLQRLGRVSTCLRPLGRGRVPEGRS